MVPFQRLRSSWENSYADVAKRGCCPSSTVEVQTIMTWNVETNGLQKLNTPVSTKVISPSKKCLDMIRKARASLSKSSQCQPPASSNNSSQQPSTSKQQQPSSSKQQSSSQQQSSSSRLKKAEKSLVHQNQFEILSTDDDEHEEVMDTSSGEPIESVWGNYPNNRGRKTGKTRDGGRSTSCSPRGDEQRHGKISPIRAPPK